MAKDRTPKGGKRRSPRSRSHAHVITRGKRTGVKVASETPTDGVLEDVDWVFDKLGSDDSKSSEEKQSKASEKKEKEPKKKIHFSLAGSAGVEEEEDAMPPPRRDDHAVMWKMIPTNASSTPRESISPSGLSSIATAPPSTIRPEHHSDDVAEARAGDDVEEDKIKKTGDGPAPRQPSLCSSFTMSTPSTKDSKKRSVSPDKVRSTKRGRKNDGEKDSIEKLVGKDLYSTDEEVLLEALEQLANRCTKEKDNNAKENGQVFYRTGGHLATIKVMEKYPNNAHIQSEGMRALLNASANMGSDIDYGIVGLGGLELILKAMKEFPDNEEIHENGCLTIWNVVYRGKERVDRLVARNGIEAIINAMEAYPMKVEIQKFACYELEAICETSADNKERMKKAHAAAAIGAAMSNHLDNADVQQWARQAMESLF